MDSRRLTFDRIEGGYAVLVGEDGSSFNCPADRLTKVREGMIYSVYLDDSGNIVEAQALPSESEKAKADSQCRLGRLFGRKKRNNTKE